MKTNPRFLSVPEVMEIHEKEIVAAGGLTGIRDAKLLESAIKAPQATFHGKFLMDIFEMAAYTDSIVLNHPFIDGNKRTALASALTFLFINGFEVDELYDEELADKILELVTHNISKQDWADFLKSRSKEIK